VSFPLYQKISANGDDRHPLYDYLTEQKGAADITNGDEFEEKLKGYGQTRANSTDILWNFEKFLIGKDGEIAARISPDVTTEDTRVLEKVKAELGK
jgi:glutathione peroxidase